MKSLLVASALLGATALLWAPAQAALVTPTDFNTITLGVEVGNSITSNFMTADLTSQGGSPPQSIGTLVGSVWFNADTSLYTYELVVTPTMANPTQFSTQFNVNGFDPSKGTAAGWSYSDAVKAGVVGSPSTAFYLLWTLHNGSSMILDWAVRSSQTTAGFWSNDAPITFFIQSIYGPMLDWYNIAGAQVGTTENWAPDPPVATPEPTSLLLLASGAVGGGWWARRRRSIRRRREPAAN